MSSTSPRPQRAPTAGGSPARAQPVPPASHKRRPCRLAFRGQLVAACLLIVAACAGSGPGARAPLVHIEATAEIAKLERALFARVNADRKQKGLAALEWDQQLADVARGHSHDMKVHGFFAHDSPTTGSLEDRLDAAGYLSLEARENLASAPTIDEAQANLLASEGHRANIFSDRVSHLGVGIVQGDRSGDPNMLTVTQIFATPGEIQSPDVVLAQVREALTEARRKGGLRALSPHAALAELAEAHVEELPIDLDGAVLGRIGDDIGEELSAQSGHGLKGVELASQVLFSASQFEPPDATLLPAGRAVGMAAAGDTDERGRPVTKVLILIGR